MLFCNFGKFKVFNNTPNLKTKSSIFICVLCVIVQSLIPHLLLHHPFKICTNYSNLHFKFNFQFNCKLNDSKHFELYIHGKFWIICTLLNLQLNFTSFKFVWNLNLFGMMFSNNIVNYFRYGTKCHFTELAHANSRTHVHFWQSPFHIIAVATWFAYLHNLLSTYSWLASARREDTVK